MLMASSTAKAILEIFTLLLANKRHNSHLVNVLYLLYAMQTLIAFVAYSIHKLILSNHDMISQDSKYYTML